MAIVYFTTLKIGHDFAFKISYNSRYLIEECAATLVRALSTCDKQNVLQYGRGGGEPQEKKKMCFESMNLQALYMCIFTEN